MIFLKNILHAMLIFPHVFIFSSSLDEEARERSLNISAPHFLE